MSSTASTRANNESNPKLLVHAALAKKPRYQVLFGKLNATQEQHIHWKVAHSWVTLWLAILAYSMGFLPRPVLLLVMAQCSIKHVGAVHDAGHLRSRPPLFARMLGLTLFCGGFMPVALCYEDIQHRHNDWHHRTRSPLEPSKYDDDSKWSHLPIWRMTLNFFLVPSHSSALEILHIYLTRPVTRWQERILSNLFHWTQLALLYRLVGNDTFWMILWVGHFTMGTIWTVFHGFTHRAEYYKWMMWMDPSGARRLGVVDTVVGLLIGKGLWLELKWHDIHHTHSAFMPTFDAPKQRGYSWDEIEAACADLVAEGLLITPEGKPTSALWQIGIQISSNNEK